MKTWTLAVLAVAWPGALAGQDQVGCFRGRPPPACRSFWIFEMQGTVPVASRDRVFVGADGSRYRADTFAEELEWNVGHMVNLTPRFAVGGVLTAGTGSPDGLAGVKARGRYRLDPEVGVELEGGWLRSRADGTEPDGVNGVTLDLRLNLGDRMSGFVRWDRLLYDPGPDAFGGTDDGFSAGLGLGSWPAVVGTGVTGVVFAVLVGVYLTDAS